MDAEGDFDHNDLTMTNDHLDFDDDGCDYDDFDDDGCDDFDDGLGSYMALICCANAVSTVFDFCSLSSSLLSSLA